jgi:S-adenosylmethionine/arginine decarboxylase-like enzyme
MKLPSGTNIRLLLSGCRCADERLTAHLALAPLVEQAVRRSEMTPLALAGHDFAAAGHSLCLVLAESHLAIHTYPECSRSAIVELTVCDHERDNRARARRLADELVALFDAREVVCEEREMVPASPLPS